jgi:hypothetical protein
MWRDALNTGSPNIRCIGKQCNGHVSAGEALSHDAGADDRRQQKRRTNGFGGQAARPCHA